MSTLTEMGMKVSHSKSEAVLALKGRDAEAVRKRFVVRRAGIDCLRIGRVDNCIYIPLKTEIKDLGILLSYGSYEFRSAQHRCKLAKAAFKRLHRVSSRRRPDLEYTGLVFGRLLRTGLLDLALTLGLWTQCAALLQCT